MRTLYTSLIRETASELGVDPDLVEAIVIQESKGEADAFRFEQNYYHKYVKNHPVHKDMIPRRAASSYGLMQIMYPTAYDLGFRGDPELLFVPSINLHWGCLELDRLLEWAKDFEGSTTRALMAYNGGQGNRSSAAERYAEQVYAIYRNLRKG